MAEVMRLGVGIVLVREIELFFSYIAHVKLSKYFIFCKREMFSDWWSLRTVRTTECLRRDVRVYSSSCLYKFYVLFSRYNLARIDVNRARCVRDLRWETARVIKIWHFRAFLERLLTANLINPCSFRRVVDVRKNRGGWRPQVQDTRIPPEV